jgi:isoleucyl-tRNA synthetase
MAAENLNFSEKGVMETLRKVNMLLWNVYKFYEMYASSVGNWQLAIGNSENVLDKWILARLNQLVAEVSDGMAKYDLPRATRPIAPFIDDLSTWYLRRSRDRFKEEGDDKMAALVTTKYVLETLSKVMAPFTPFIAEQLWQKVTGNNFANADKSVHLESWPEASVSFRRRPESSDSDENDVLEKMAAIRKVIEMGLSLRDEAGLKVRQPLASVTVWDLKIDVNYEALVKDELNVKDVKYKNNEKTNFIVGIDFKVDLDKELTPELIAEGLKRELVRFINAERKNAGLSIGDRIKLSYSTESENVKNVFKLFVEDLKKDVLADEISEGGTDGGKEVEANGERLSIKIEKL